MRLAELSDLDLAALTGALHEATMSAIVLELCPEIFSDGIKAAIREALRRRSAGARAETDLLFAPGRSIPTDTLPGLRELVAHIVARLDSLGFPSAGALVANRFAGEILIAAEAQPRTLN